MTALLPRPAEEGPHKKLVRRSSPDRSQIIRHTVQWTFVALNLWLGAQFYLWVRFFERGGQGFHASRPAGIEGWLPIAGLMNTRYLLTTGRVPAIHPAAMYLFLGFALMSVLLKKAFCSWLCPVGTLSENLWKFGRRVLRTNVRVPRSVDGPLRSLKYVLLAFFVVLVGSMSAETLEGFMQTPYGLVVDVRMMNFFRDIGGTGAAIVVALAGLSILIENFWCRYLCPYGAFLGLASILSPTKIRRDPEACIDCAKCARVCPAHLPVDRLVQIRSAECTACMVCVAACPAQDALQLALPPRKETKLSSRWAGRRLSPLAVAAVIAYLFFGAVLWARVTNHWQTNLPQSIYQDLVPRANQLSHPGS